MGETRPRGPEDRGMVPQGPEDAMEDGDRGEQRRQVDSVACSVMGEGKLTLRRKICDEN